MAHWSEWTPNPRPAHDTSTFQEHRNWLQLRIVLLIARFTPRSPEVVRLLSLGMDQPLPLTTRVKLRIHIRSIWPSNPYSPFQQTSVFHVRRRRRL